MTTIASNLQAVRSSVLDATLAAGRHATEINVLAVSKACSADAVRAAFQCGQTRFAESYVQEALNKMAGLADLPIEWHFIGPIQSNKTRVIASNFAWVHSLDRLKIAERLSEQRPANLPPLQVCLQINISGEESKHGISPDTTLTLAQAIARLPNLRLRGLMAIPAPSATPDAQPFAQLRILRDQLNQHGLQLDTLSMGMSHDFTVAIAEGATMLRIGTAIFGARIYPEEIS